MKKQQEFGSIGIVQLKKLSDTQWSCRYTSIKAVLTSLSAIIATLDEIGDQSHNRAIEARGLFFQVKSLHCKKRGVFLTPMPHPTLGV